MIREGKAIMSGYDLKLLDCTLRDGGYINDWKWGFDTARNIIYQLSQAKVDIIEVGFLRNIYTYNPDITVCNSIEELNRLLPEKICDNVIFSAMAMRSNYDIRKLTAYNGTGIEMIRITAHDYDIEDGMKFAREVKEKGYKLSINPINIMGYSDSRILWIIDQVNTIQPHQFSIVDTFGSMKRRDLDRIVSLVDNNLDKNIRVALHLHENMSLSFSLAQNYIDKHLNRPVSIDGSLMGMGRIPGNLPIELISDYLNEYTGKKYDIDYMMDAIQDYIEPLKGHQEWGYTPAYYLSARYNLHRNYAEYYLKKGDITNKDINHILAAFDRSKCTVFDEEYANVQYEDYKNRIIDDRVDREKLKRELNGKRILIIAPGASLAAYNKKIKDFISKNKTTVISLNFIPKDIIPEYAFFSNNKRFDIRNRKGSKLIVTSNIAHFESDFKINYNSLSGAFEQGYNSFIMMLRLLSDLGIDDIYAAGADGYTSDGYKYYLSTFHSNKERSYKYNADVFSAIERIGIKVRFITPSEYDKNKRG